MNCLHFSGLAQRQRTLIFILLTLCTLILSSCATRHTAALPPYGQIKSLVGERYLERPTRKEVEKLIAAYGTNKQLIDEYADILIVALSYYPELKGTRIIFEYSNEKTTMASRPSKVFFGRAYRVLINKNKNFKGIPFDSIPYNAAVGIVGHELAHIVDYESLNTLGLIDRLLLYADKSHGKSYFEKSVDLITINRGLGCQLYDWAKFAMYDNTVADEEYKEFKRRTYLTPEEIMMYIRHYSRYHNPNETAEED